jgi:hypothetical protein
LPQGRRARLAAPRRAVEEVLARVPAGSRALAREEWAQAEWAARGRSTAAQLGSPTRALRERLEPRKGAWAAQRLR